VCVGVWEASIHGDGAKAYLKEYRIGNPKYELAKGGAMYEARQKMPLILIPFFPYSCARRSTSWRTLGDPVSGPIFVPPVDISLLILLTQI